MADIGLCGIGELCPVKLSYRTVGLWTNGTSSREKAWPMGDRYSMSLRESMDEERCSAPGVRLGPIFWNRKPSPGRLVENWMFQPGADIDGGMSAWERWERWKPGNGVVGSDAEWSGSISMSCGRVRGDMSPRAFHRPALPAASALGRIGDAFFSGLTGGALGTGRDRPRSFPRLATPTPQVNCVLYPEQSFPTSRHCEQYGRRRSHLTFLLEQVKQSSAAPPPAARLLRLRTEAVSALEAGGLAWTGRETVMLDREGSEGVYDGSRHRREAVAGFQKGYTEDQVDESVWPPRSTTVDWRG